MRSGSPEHSRAPTAATALGHHQRRESFDRRSDQRTAPPVRAGSYPSIDDWSPVGRRRLVRAQQLEIRLLLDEAFTNFTDSTGISLRAFRFKSDDPVTEAVRWCMQRFSRDDLEFDPRRLWPRSRSMRLFTQSAYWLAQRETVNGYRRILREHRQLVSPLSTTAGSAFESQ